jgi:outer membrane receptor protein involved in Fe transport
LVAFTSATAQATTGAAKSGRTAEAASEQQAVEGQPEAANAQARTASAGAPEPAAIVVTASRRAERLLDTPQSVSVVTSQELEKTGATQFRDYASKIPGLSYFSFGAGYTQITLRGTSIGFNVSPTVAIYVDDVPYGSSSAFAGSTFTAIDAGLLGLDRIEVLRGPQGTLYGASSVGGLVKYVTSRPDSENFAGHLKAGIATTRHGSEGFNAGGELNIPIAPGKAGLRASAFEFHDGGFVDNVTLGKKDVDRSDIYGGRVDLLLTPADRFSVRLTGYAQDVKRDGNNQVDYNFDRTPVIGDLKQSRLAPEPFDSKFRLVSAVLNYDLGAADLSWMTSYQTVRTTQWADGSVAFVPLLAAVFHRNYSSVANRSRYNTDKFTQEVRLTSSGQRRVQWIIGGFYTHEKSHNVSEFVLRDPSGNPAPNDVNYSLVPSTLGEVAGYADVTVNLTPKFDITGGLRYAHNNQKFSQIGSGLLGVSRPKRGSTEDVVTYLANARYRFSPRLMAYLRFATGYRPGGPNYSGIDPTTGETYAPADFKSDRLQSYEAGLKAESADRRLSADISAYYINWDDIQITASRNIFSVRVNAAGGATVRGLEAAFTARPVDGLDLSAALAYQDAEMSRDDADLHARAHERLPNIPRFTANLNADYTFVGPYRPSIGATYSYMSDRNSGFDAGTGLLRQYELGKVTSLDLRAGMTFGKVNVQAYAKNVFDKRSQIAAYTALGLPRVSVTPPRTIGVNVDTRF